MLTGKSFETYLRSDYLCDRRDFVVNSCCNSFTSLNQPYQLPPGYSMCFQKNMGYFFGNENDVFNSDYSWRKYYSDLAVTFSQSNYTHSKPFCDFVKTENCMSINKNFIQYEYAATDSSSGSREFLRNSTNDRIWRPFSLPSPDIGESSSSEANNFGEINQNLKMLQKNSIKYQPVASVGRLDHSSSSVFVPIKKKNINSSSATYDTMGSHAHWRIKPGSKPYACDYPKCFKCFSRNEELTRHKRIHSGFKPHQCSVCGKSFGRKDHLSKHLKTHLQASEKKVYMCCVLGCGHRYTRSDALTRHKSTAHSISKSKKSTKTLEIKKN